MKTATPSVLSAPRTRLLASLVLAAGLAIALGNPRHAAADPVTTAITYQGGLSSGGLPVNGVHDFQFRLFDAPSGGAQVGPTLCVDNLLLVDGQINVSLDFGNVFVGQRRFLEIQLRPDSGQDCSNASGMTVLSPRQELTASPHAAYSLAAGTATSAISATNAATAANATTAANAILLGGQAGAFYQNAANLTGILPDARLAGTYSGAVSLSNAANAFTGSGAGLSSLNAGGISTGTLSDARLSANVAMRNAANSFDNSTNTFAGSVGIGTLTPNDKLEVKGSVVLRNTGNNPALRLSPSNAGFGIDPEFFIQDTANGTGADTGFHLSRNAFFRGSDATYNRVDVAEAATSLQFLNDDTILFAYAPTGANPLVWQTNLQINGSSGNITVASGDLYLPIGKLGIGTTNPAYALNFSSALGDKISLSGTGSNHYGLGIQNNQLQIHTQNSNGDITFGYGNSASLTENVRFLGDGRVGVGISTPDDTMLHTFTSSRSSSATVETSLAGGVGLNVLATATTLDTVAGSFSSSSNAGTALYAIATRTSGVTYGLRAYVSSNAANAMGVRGECTASGANYGVYGSATGASAFGVYSNGRLGSSGTKSFMIDHPLDPQNKFLLHYSMESPEVLNVYTGVVPLDAAGEAWVTLPDYYESINIEPRYMLTSIGAPAPMLHVAQEITANQFKIAGGAPGAKVSWEIKARRNDRFVQQNGAPVERVKIEGERGTYLHPELYGKPASMGQFFNPPRDPSAKVDPSQISAASSK